MSSAELPAACGRRTRIDVPRGDPRTACRASAPARGRRRLRPRGSRDPHARRDDDPDGRPRLVRQRGVVRRLRVRAPAALDGAPRLDLAHRLLRRRAGHVRLHRARALAVGTYAGRRRVRASGAKRRGAYVVAFTNDPASELAREADAVLELRAGPERAVAATKTYSNQLAALGLLAAHAAGEGATRSPTSCEPSPR